MLDTALQPETCLRTKTKFIARQDFITGHPGGGGGDIAYVENHWPTWLLDLGV